MALENKGGRGGLELARAQHTETLDRVAHKRRDESVSLLLNRIKKLQPIIYEKALNPKYECYVQRFSVKPL